MNDDALVRAARALREATNGTSSEAPSTRARILVIAVRRKRRRRFAVVVALPIAAAFVLSTAWAAVTGRIPHVLARRWAAPPPVEHGVSTGGTPGLSGAATGAIVSEGPTADRARAEAVALDPKSADPQTPSAQTTAATMDRPGLPAARVDATPPSRPPRTNSDAKANAETALYGEAHRTHFLGHDPNATLRAWDAYLAAYPEGRFAPEARYNRALTLVRLGERTKARAALAPFAEGPPGSYRQHEARALLDAMTAEP